MTANSGVKIARGEIAIPAGSGRITPTAIDRWGHAIPLVILALEMAILVRITPNFVEMFREMQINELPYPLEVLTFLADML